MALTITKLGHCCLLIEIDGARILTDPGEWTTAQTEVRDLDVVLITHEHADHLHVASLATVMANNPAAQIITNTSVSAIVQAQQLSSQVVEHNQSAVVAGLTFEGVGSEHADIAPGIPAVQNTGYRIAERFFYPGDALTLPHKTVEILALPVVGPWLKISEAVAFAHAVKPRLCFPVHDGMLAFPGPFHAVPQRLLAAAGLDFRVLPLGEATSL